MCSKFLNPCLFNNLRLHKKKNIIEISLFSYPCFITKISLNLGQVHNKSFQYCITLFGTKTKHCKLERIYLTGFKGLLYCKLGQAENQNKIRSPGQ